MELFLITVAWLFGILSGLYFKIGIAFFVLAFLVLFCYSYHHKKWNIKKYSMIFLICYLLSYFQIVSLEKSFQEKYKQMEEVQVVGTIISNPTSKEYKTSYILKVESINQDTSYQNTKLLLQIKKEKNIKQYAYGNQICFTGTFQLAECQRNEGGFDYQQYLKTQNIAGIVTTKTNQITVQKENNINILMKSIHHIASKIEGKAYQLLDKQEASLLTAILIGEKAGLQEEVQEAFQKSNLSHMLAVSGAHTSYVIVGISFLLATIKIGKRKTKILTILFLLFFMLLTNQTPSVTRACYMAIYFILATLCHKKVSSLSAICISMLLLMFQNPYCIFDIGFQLSYGGTIGILLFFPILKNISFFQKKKEHFFHKEITIKGIQKIKEIMLVTMSANLILFPLILYHFNTFSFSFLLSNLLASPLMGILVLFGFFTIFVSFVFLPLGKLCSICLSFFLTLLLKIAIQISHFPFSQIKLPTPSITGIIGYYLFLAFLWICAKKKWLACKRINKKKIVVILLLIMIFYLAYLQIPKQFQINFIDVGQGDSMLVTTPHGKTILVDGGGAKDTTSFDVGKNTLIPYLLDKGITTLDYVFISHFDADHVGGILTLLEEMKVKEVVISKQGENSQNYESFKKIVKERKIKVDVVKQGDILHIEKEVTVQILWPKEEQIQENILNNNSIVAKLTYQTFSILLTGDIEEIAEEKIIEEYQNTNRLKASVLKVAHHGSKTSSIPEFLNEVKPKIALIGVGKNNTFGHPNENVLERLRNMRNKNL